MCSEKSETSIYQLRHGGPTACGTDRVGNDVLAYSNGMLVCHGVLVAQRSLESYGVKTGVGVSYKPFDPRDRFRSKGQLAYARFRQKKFGSDEQDQLFVRAQFSSHRSGFVVVVGRCGGVVSGRWRDGGQSFIRTKRGRAPQIHPLQKQSADIGTSAQWSILAQHLRCGYDGLRRLPQAAKVVRSPMCNQDHPSSRE